MRQASIRTRALAVGVVTALALAACGSTAPTPTPTLAPSPSPGPSATDSPVPTAVASGGIVVDQTLLDHLPVEVGGIALVSDPDTAGNIATDPDLATNASAIAVAFAIGPGASGDDDVAVVSVVQLRPGVFDDGFFRDWRDSYDAAACDAAGGVAGNAQAEIDGRTVHIATCAAGAHTYHAFLEDASVIVSVTSVGELRLGEQIVAGLRE
jgi:hypothetical protein